MLKNLFKLINDNISKTLMIIVFIYPIIPLVGLALMVLIGVVWQLLTKGMPYSSLTQFFYQFLLFSGGLSGLIAGLMVIFNKVKALSVLLFLHGAISYSFIAALIIKGTPWNSVWSLHGAYIVLSLAVIYYQLAVVVMQVFKQKFASKPAL